MFKRSDTKCYTESKINNFQTSNNLDTLLPESNTSNCNMRSHIMKEIFSAVSTNIPINNGFEFLLFLLLFVLYTEMSKI